MNRGSALSVALLALLSLGACQSLVPLPAQPAQATEYDLGPQVPAAGPAGLQPREVVVVAPSWLSTPAMHYRLLYEQSAQRYSYAENRWVAPPGELLAAALRRALIGDTAAGVQRHCRLRLEVEELVQSFSAPAQSRFEVEVRATLLGPMERSLGSKRFAESVPSPSADAKGGAVAASAAVQGMGSALRDWLQALAREGAVAKICSGG